MITLARWILATFCLCACTWLGVAHAGPGMPDPRQMSGIPRPDPQLEAGTVTVRVLRGGFDAPALEHEVSLTLRGRDGKTETRRAKTDDVKGRAVFDGLAAYVGGTAIASVELDGETLESQPMQLLGNTGTAVMLVGGAGAGDQGGDAPAHGQPGGPAMPLLGEAFPLPDTPAGQVTVGTFDLMARAPIAGVEVELEITPPEGEPIVRRGTTDAEGRFAFPGLLPPDIPAGSKMVASATLREGAERRRSKPFEISEESGLAVLLVEGAEQLGDAANAHGAAPKARARLPGPRLLTSLPAGTVQVRLVDSSDNPVAGQDVVVVQKTAEGTGGSWRGRTGRTGMAQIPGVEVRGDAFYVVTVLYDGAPWQSGFFNLDKRGGVAVDLRVFEVTADPSVIRTGLTIDVVGLENDHAQVVHIYEGFVNGSKAFWPPGGLKISAMKGAKGMIVLRRAEPWLDHEEKADFVKLAGPLPPGELLNLSFGYVIEHDGVLRFDWAAPFEVVESTVLLGPELTLEAAGARLGAPHPQLPDKEAWELGPRPAGGKIEFSIGGLPTTNPIFRRLALWLGVAIGLAAAIGIVSKPRRGARERLLRRRDELLVSLEQLDRDADPARHEAILSALDRTYRQLRALDALAKGEAPSASGEP
jgi:hypothetical protein